MNRPMSLLSVVALSIVSASALADLSSGVKDPVARPTPAPLPGVPACVDPAITKIGVRNITRLPSGAYTFTLSAVLRNAGTADYRSQPNQQTVAVYEVGLGARRLLTSQRFGNLRVGEVQEIRLGVPSWWVSNEFPPSYEFAIQYDPDIAIDGNRANDDCRSANNKLGVTSEEINAQLRASGR